jgi:hypothetical protein
MKADPCDDLVIVDPGDLTEGFENTAQQAHTNDLSFPDQLDLANVVLTEIVTAARRRSRLDARRHRPEQPRRLARARIASDGPVTTSASSPTAPSPGRSLLATTSPSSSPSRGPSPWRCKSAAPCSASRTATRRTDPTAIRDWWKAQTHGGMPTAAATILVTGHYHHLRVEPSGAIDGRARWWFQAPTLDNGSSWWANGAGGGDTEPGLLTFTIDDAGRWDGLRLLTA